MSGATMMVSEALTGTLAGGSGKPFLAIDRDPMKVAIPTQGSKGLEDQLFKHFGKAPTFTIADLVTGGLTVIDNTSDHMGGRGSPPELIKATGADTVAVDHLGEKAAQRLAEIGIVVLCGASGSVSDVLEQLRSGKLGPPSRETMCDHHH